MKTLFVIVVYLVSRLANKHVFKILQNKTTEEKLGSVQNVCMCVCVFSFSIPSLTVLEKYLHRHFK